MSEKQTRQTAIKELIATKAIPNQEALADLLLERGIKATQTTLSRDLNELGIWKGPEGYVLGNEAAPVRATKTELKKVLQSLLVSAEVADSLVVLKTQPGRAQAIGYELDNIKLPLVVGNISGDDTVFIATRSREDAMQLKLELEQMI
ncbi:MAG: arginine repressor [Gammaproteobacteria bacterium]|nr:arginine repressor [Gammaproteobacteria bacterium]NVK88206.1 arginine repressor [Gammaproteobacteria bacterium]